MQINFMEISKPFRNMEMTISEGKISKRSSSPRWNVMCLLTPNKYNNEKLSDTSFNNE
jgi:hypothetical protein